MTDRVIRVLLVDGQVEDSNWIRELLAELEESKFGGGWRHGVEVFPIDRLSDAIILLDDMATRERTDAVLLNPNLPDSAGLNTLLKIRGVAPDVPVVILADFDDPDLAVSLVRAGAQDYLAKTDLDSVPLARALRLAVERGRILTDLRAMSSQDELTGLLNRRGFVAAAAQEAAAALRLGVELAVLTVEAIGLDQLARRYGREEAQLMLITAADALRDASNGYCGALGRTDSARFAVCLTAQSKTNVSALLAQVEQRFRLKLNKATRGMLRVCSGAGWVAPIDGGNDLLASAERALCENMGANSAIATHHEQPLAAAQAAYSAGRNV